MGFFSLFSTFGGASSAQAEQKEEPLRLEDVSMFASMPIVSGYRMDGETARWDSRFIRALRISDYHGLTTEFKMTIHRAPATQREGKLSYGAADIDSLAHLPAMSFKQALEFVRNWEQMCLTKQGGSPDVRELQYLHHAAVQPVFDEAWQKAQSRFKLVV